MLPRPLFAVALVLLLSACVWAGFSWWLRRSEPDLSGIQVVPAGRWHIDHARSASSDADTDIGADEDALARVMSLPYVSGSHPADSRSGVVVYDVAQAADGINLYVSGHGPDAVLLDMDGRVLHRWRLPFEEAFGVVSDLPGTTYWRRAHLMADGSLLAIFQAGGMVKIDRDSDLVWAVDEGFYNDLEVSGDDEILVIGKAARIVPEINPDEPVLEDSIVTLAPDGTVRRRLSLLRAFLDSPFRELLEPIKHSGDIFHSNTVEWLDGRYADLSDLFRRGNLLVSLREVDIVAIIDPLGGVVEWAARGPWDAQHQPTLLDDGTLLIFDNQGNDGFSRVLEFDPVSAETKWQYPPMGSQLLASPEAGSCQRLIGGTTLITESERGRAIEVTREGTVVWEFLSPHRAGVERDLVATLFEVERLPRQAAAFLDNR
jgi:hypothetical protein